MDGSLLSLRDVAIILIVGAIAGYIALRLKMPTIIGYIIAGVLLSIILPLLNISGGLNSNFVGQIASFGVALLLFAAGIEFSVNNIKKIRNLVVVGVVLQTTLTILFAIVLMPIFGLDTYEALFVGVVAATSSTAFVLKMLEQNEELSSTASNIMVGWLIVQDVLAIALFLIIKSFAPGNTINLASLADPVIKSVILIVLTFTFGRIVVPPIFKEISKTKSQELLLVSVIALSIGFALLSEVLGVSYTLGAFLTGLALSGTFLKHEIFTEIKPLRDLFSMVFFVSIGSLLNVSSIFNNIPIILAIVVIVLGFKVVTIFLVNIFFKTHPKNSAKVALGISQIGEFAFLAITIAQHNNWININFYSVILVSTVISMTLTPILYSNYSTLFKISEKIFSSYFPGLYGKYYLSKLKSSQKSELSNHVIIVGYGKVGKYVAEALNISKEDYVVIELDANLIEKAISDNHKVILGDATNIDTLKEAKIEFAKALVLALPESNHELLQKLILDVKDLNKKIEIIVRSSKVVNDTDNISSVIEPEFEAAVRIISKMEGIISENKYSLVRKIRAIRRKEIKEILENN